MRPRRLGLNGQYIAAVFTCALTKACMEDVREWLMELIPWPPNPRELEAWELE